MKKLLLILVFLVSFTAFGQKVGADVLKMDSITSTVRDTYDVPYGERWWIWNGTTGQFEYAEGDDTWAALGAGSGDVTSASNITDNSLIRGDGGSKGIQESGILIDDSDIMTFPSGGTAGLDLDGSALDMGGGEIQSAGETDVTLLSVGQYMLVTPTDSEPSGIEGRLYADDSENRPKYYDGTSWKAFLLAGDAGDLSSADVDTYSELNTIVADQTLTHNGLIDTSAEIAAIVGDETGSGALVFATSPTLVTPALGTPASGVMTNVTGIVSAGIVDGTIAEADIAGDAITEGKIADAAIQEEHLKAVNSPTDEYVLTYESTTGDFEWQAAAAASLPVVDTSELIEGSADATKLLRFENDTHIPTSTTVVVTAPSADLDLEEVVISDPSAVTGADAVTNIMSLTQSEYDAITPDASTVYIITDAKQEFSITIPLTAIGGDVAAGTDLNFWEVHDAITLTRVAGFVLTAGTTSTITIDIHEDGTTVMSTDKIEIEAGDKWSEDATDQPVISDTAINAQSILTFDIDGADSGDTGTDPSVTIWYTVD